MNQAAEAFARLFKLIGNGDEPPPNADDLREVAGIVAELASRGPCEHVHGSVRCFDRQARKVSRRANPNRRGFQSYEPGEMCDSCAACWYAEMAAQAFNRLADPAHPANAPHLREARTAKKKGG